MLQEKVERSIKLLKTYEDVALSRCPKGYIVGYSGGKDSDALVELFFISGVKFHIIHNHTTIDAPETVYYIRKRMKEFESRGATTEIIYPEKTIWQLIADKGRFPTRLTRFCCVELKEKKKPEYRYAVYSFGVRKAESVKRAKNRDEIEMRNNSSKKSQNFRFDDDNCKVIDACYSNNYIVVNPIVDWSEKDVFQFLNNFGLDKSKLNPLYSKGYCRVGCIGCPMSSNQKAELSLYPKYKQAYINVANKILNKKGCRLPFNNGEEFVDWWTSSLSVDDWIRLQYLKENQIKMF